MRNPFPDNEVFQRFLGLKNYFRRFTTKESQRRTREISKIARSIQKSGDTISFDILGSVNFGMANENSDVDMVIYLDCGHEQEADYNNCPKLRFYETLVIRSLIEEISNNPFNIQVVDCINLQRLEKAIEKELYDDDIITRFVFYRTICRGINKRAIRSYEQKIMKNSLLFKRIEYKLTDALIEFTRSSGHNMSFHKYISRLKEENVNLSPSIIEKVIEYLNTSNNNS